MQLKSFSARKKVVIIIVIFNVSVVAINLILIFFYGTQVRSNLEWLLGSEDKIILSNLLFVEGAVTVGIGALLAAGFAENRMQGPRGPSTPYIVEKLAKQRSEFREKQISTGLLLILAGLPLIIISILSAVV